MDIFQRPIDGLVVVLALRAEYLNDLADLGLPAPSYGQNALEVRPFTRAGRRGAPRFTSSTISALAFFPLGPVGRATGRRLQRPSTPLKVPKKDGESRAAKHIVAAGGRSKSWLIFRSGCCGYDRMAKSSSSGSKAAQLLPSEPASDQDRYFMIPSLLINESFQTYTRWLLARRSRARAQPARPPRRPAVGLFVAVAGSFQ
jgi:hypothetical protein